jgi:hypothetical protein
MNNLELIKYIEGSKKYYQGVKKGYEDINEDDIFKGIISHSETRINVYDEILKEINEYK